MVFGKPSVPRGAKFRILCLSRHLPLGIGKNDKKIGMFVLMLRRTYYLRSAHHWTETFDETRMCLQES